MKFIIPDTKAKHTNITTNYRDNQNRKVFTKVIKMPSLKVWVQIPGGQIKRSGKRKRFKEGVP